MATLRICLATSLGLLLAGTHALLAAAPVGGPCDGCEVALVDMPAALGSDARIAPPDEPGEALTIEGVVYAADGTTPAAGVVVYAYHTDVNGHYPAARSADGRRVVHGRLRGWARTGSDGRYRFTTIRPAPYPGRSVPAHVHVQLVEPGLPPYYLDDLVFEDDPLVDASWRARQPGRGGGGIVAAARQSGAGWHARRDLYVGRAIPNHPATATGER